MYLARGGCSLGLLAVVAALVAAPSHSAASDAPAAPLVVSPTADDDRFPELDPNLLLSLDLHLIHSDFVGLATATHVTETVTGSHRGRSLELRVKEAWASRWPARATLTANIVDADDFGNLWQEGAEYLVLIAGGPWRQSPFTHRQHSVYRVGSDGTLTCASGNRVYGLSNHGFVCLSKEYAVGEPVNVAQLRTQLADHLKGALLRYPGLGASLDSLRRPLMLSPTREIDIDRSLAANQGGLR